MYKHIGCAMMCNDSLEEIVVQCHLSGPAIPIFQLSNDNLKLTNHWYVLF